MSSIRMAMRCEKCKFWQKIKRTERINGKKFLQSSKKPQKKKEKVEEAPKTETTEEDSEEPSTE